MTFELRDYTMADRDAVGRIWHASRQATGLADERDPTPDGYRARLEAEERNWSIRIACADGVIVGFAAFHLAEGRVRQLFVRPSRQREGIGTRLLDDARRAMPNGFRLRTDRDNGPARRFYETGGLRLEGEGAHPEGGHPIATYRWASRLARSGLTPGRARDRG